MTQILKKNDVIYGRYKVVGYIGEGGMQEVYRALDNSLLREVALKVPKNDSGTKRFARSAAMSAKVTHPNVAKTYDYVNDGGHQYLVEELITGHDLRELLDTLYSCLDPHLTAHVFHHLAKGLAAVHREGVIHRDLKPGNIMLSDDHDLSAVKITDFGIAKMAEREIIEGIQAVRDETLASRTVVGAIPYMAPEVLENRDDVSTKADIWSLGCIIFHLLTGERPFGDGLQAVQRILSRNPPQKPQILAQASPQFRQLVDELWTLILQCLEPLPQTRPDAQALVDQGNRLCYSRASRAEGVVNNFKPKNGSWGFISSAAYRSATFFHAESYWPPVTPEIGRRVCFARFPGIPQPRAHPVLVLRDQV